MNEIDPLAKVYELCEKGKIDDAIDELIDSIDDRLRADHFSEVEEIIEHTDWSRLEYTLIFSFYVLIRKAPIRNKGVAFKMLSGEDQEDLKD